MRATSSENRPCSAFPGGVYLRNTEDEGGRRREEDDEGGRREEEGRLVQRISLHDCHCLYSCKLRAHTHTHTHTHTRKPDPNQGLAQILYEHDTALSLSTLVFSSPSLRLLFVFFLRTRAPSHRAPCGLWMKSKEKSVVN